MSTVVYKSLPYLFKYEKTNLIGIRMRQLEQGAPTFVRNQQNVETIALIELFLSTKKINLLEQAACDRDRNAVMKNAGCNDDKIAATKTILPLKIIREMPNGETEIWNLNDLSDIDDINLGYSEVELKSDVIIDDNVMTKKKKEDSKFYKKFKKTEAVIGVGIGDNSISVNLNENDKWI
jgi:DNA-directed RNA polymerase subunit K/omega